MIKIKDGYTKLVDTTASGIMTNKKITKLLERIKSLEQQNTDLLNEINELKEIWQS